MDERDVYRVFDQTRPSQEQKEAMLDRLLEPERKVAPMKKLKKLTLVGIAAALMVVICAAAVVTGIDQRLIDFLGGGERAQELLAPGAQPVDVTVENNGAALHVTQALLDRYSILILADFTAPEGTVLDMNEELEDNYCGFGGLDRSVPSLLNQAGEEIDLDQSWSCQVRILDDGDPLDNHLTLLLRMGLDSGIQPDWDIGGLQLPANDLICYDPEAEDIITVYSGDWSCQFPITWQDMGRSIQLDQVAGHLDGADITVTEVYLSPMTLQIKLERETPVAAYGDKSGTEVSSRWYSAVSGGRVTLTTGDGQSIPLTELGGSGSKTDQDASFQLGEITGLDRLQGGTLTLRIGDESCDIPLDGLAPAE